MKFNSFLGGALTTLALVLGASFVYQRCDRTPSVVNTVVTSETATDTVPHFIDSPVPKDSVILRYETIKVPVYDTIPIVNVDTLVVDSVAVELPITQKVYRDSTYEAWVSGYSPALDSIRIYQPITTITNTITTTEIRYKAKRWGVGLQLGIGVTPSKIEPYVGVGVTYNIFSW